MAINDLFHINLSVSDLERSSKWYCDVLGMEVIRRVENTSKEVGLMMNLQGNHTKTAILKKPAQAGFYIEMTEWLSPKGIDLPVGGNNGIGAYHFGFLVDDIDAEYARMKGMGVRFKSPPITVASGVRACYFFDPDNILLEIAQMPKSYSAYLGPSSRGPSSARS